jgi:hypothetical protein
MTPAFLGDAGAPDLPRFAIWNNLKSSAAIVAMRPSRRLLARGRARGLPLTQMYAWVATMEDRQVVHQPKYLDHAEALGVVGLPDQATSQKTSRTSGSKPSSSWEAIKRWMSAT